MLGPNVIQAKDIDGLLPALDPRQPGKPFAIAGKNFKWTVQGPESSFGARYIGKQAFSDVELVETFRVNGKIIYAGGEALYMYDPLTLTLYPIFIFTSTPDNQYPWTFVQNLTKFYFCRRGLGIFEYNSLTEVVTQITDPVLPVNVTAITVCRGRLIVLGSDFYAWSEIENPVFTLSLATGAGQQALSLVGGNPLSVKVIADAFLVYTTTGIGIAEFSDNVNVFRHEILTREYKAINPFCIVDIDEGKHLFCDRKGLFTTTGQKPEPYIPLFGEFLNQTLLKSRDLLDFTVFRMRVASDQRLLFFSVCEPSNHVRYQKSYCLHIPTEKWGSFDRIHYGFGELNTGLNATYDFNFGYIDENGYFQRITGEAFVEGTMRPVGGYLFHADGDIASYQEGTLHVATSWMIVSADFENMLGDGVESGFYIFDIADHQVDLQTIFNELISQEGNPNIVCSTLYIDAGVGEIIARQSDIQRNSLDAYVTLGLFRFSELKFENELGEIVQLSVHSGDIAAEEEDWLILSGEEDLLTSELPDEDWGTSVSSGDSYIVTLTGTNDGVKVFENHQQVLENLASVTERVRRYAGNSVKGLFHHTKISAEEFPDTFHVKILELTGIGAGRIQ